MSDGMASDESDDEPLAVLASLKKSDPRSFIDATIIEGGGDCDNQPKKKRIKRTKGSAFKKSALTITLSSQLKNFTQPVVQRPADVWLYLKDFNQIGPYSCLLCSEWFVNRSKIVIHYVLNHKRDFCGICRYFVADKDAWEEHTKFHIPWSCSQCLSSFPKECDLRQHLSVAHKLVHCRLCHFRLADGDQYHSHLLKKHNITNLSVKDEEILWKLESESSHQFTCILCNKTKNSSITFVGHYLGYHHFTLKCLASLISGKDLPFIVLGADVSPEFVESLKDQGKWGYTDLELRPPETVMEPNTLKEDSESILKSLLLDIKQESLSDHEDMNNEDGQNKNEKQIEEKNFGETQAGNSLPDSIKSYRGNSDFDVALMELIVLEKSFFTYISQSLSDSNSNVVSEIFEIKYDKNDDFPSGIHCELCPQKFINTNEFSSHMQRQHSVKIISIYSCRVCATTFENYNELSAHTSEELGAFEDLWLCQFCDHEFIDRPGTRRHLTEHWDIIDSENCFSPHLGFKCRHCPVLFWDEWDREQHQVRAHFLNNLSQFYKCICNEVYSDKVWFTYHYRDKHSKDTPVLFKCCLCATVLSTVKDMRVHFEKLHPEARKIFCSLDSCSYRPLSNRKSFALHVKTQHAAYITGSSAGVVTNTPAGTLASTGTSAGTLASTGTSAGAVANTSTAGASASTDPATTPAGVSTDPATAPAGVSTEAGMGRRPRSFACAVCGRVFGTPRARSLHAVQAHGTGRFRCKLCDIGLQSMDERKLHYLIRHPGQHPYECTICGKSFQYKSSLYIHKQEHAPNKQTYTCNFCEKVFTKKDSFREHLQIHEGPRHACSYCPMRFVQRSNMLRHERRHTGERPYHCDHCDRTFADKGACNAHSRSHSKESCFACLYCGQTFVQKSKLTYHVRKHTGENLETCPVCSKLFTSGCSLRQHMKSHEEKAVDMIACPLCDRKYRDERNMLRHLRACHTGPAVPCPLCQKPFSSAAGLRHHVLTHATTNIFRCKMCPKSYAVRRSLTKHLHTRHNLKRGNLNLKEFYNKLDPRECKLNLDEETITSIFGPRKRKNDVILRDCVTYKTAEQLPRDESTEENDDDDDDDGSDEEKNSDEDMNQDETTDPQEIPEPDFVAVKIEPYDADD